MVWRSLALAVLLFSPASVAGADDVAWNVTLRSRNDDGSGQYRLQTRQETWDARKTAIIVVDMWNDHHCRAAARRVVEMAPVMNKVLEAARDKGVLVIFAPSNCMDYYEPHPARRRARAAPFAAAKVKFQWNYFNPDREGPLAEKLEAAGCSCDSPRPCGPDRRVWTHQIKTLDIQDTDAISDDGQEVFNLLTQRDIANVIVMGVHTNRCVLGRPFGIRQLVYVGKKVVLCRDLTDSYHRDPGHHFQGLHTIVEHVEKYWCPTITSQSITGAAPFTFDAAPGRQ